MYMSVMPLLVPRPRHRAADNHPHLNIKLVRSVQVRLVYILQCYTWYVRAPRSEWSVVAVVEAEGYTSVDLCLW